MNNNSHLEISKALEEFYEDFICNGNSKTTLVCYSSNLRLWQRFIQEKGVTNLTQITQELIMSYRHYLQVEHKTRFNKNIAVSVQSQKLSALKSFLSFCVRTGKMLFDPSQHLIMPKVSKKLPRTILSQQEMKKLLKLPNTKTPIGFRDRIILELFYATGVRRQELVSIRTEDCHINERLIFIRYGKGGTQRWVPIGKKVTAILIQYMEVIRPFLLKHQTHDFLIVGDKGGSIKGRRVYNIVSQYLEKLGIKADCHALRHTCATHLLQGKANIRVIQSILGHSSLNTTQIYTHVDVSHLAKLIQKAHPRESMQCDNL